MMSPQRLFMLVTNLHDCFDNTRDWNKHTKQAKS
jgi:hypothetical protein